MAYMISETVAYTISEMGGLDLSEIYTQEFRQGDLDENSRE
jgi:hypothetical protein